MWLLEGLLSRRINNLQSGRDTSCVAAPSSAKDQGKRTTV